MGKIIDTNEFIKWCLENNPSQSKINTIKKYWKCKTKEDYLNVFKDKIEHDKKFWWDGETPGRVYDPDRWIEYQYCWELDKLFDIYKFVDNCPLLSEIHIGYSIINDALRSDKWQEYIEVVKVYNKPHLTYRVQHSSSDTFECTFRIIKLDFGEFQIYARQARALSKPGIWCSESNINNAEEDAKEGYEVIWYDEQRIFMSVPEIKINKALLKSGNVKLQKNKRLYCFSDGKAWSKYSSKYRLPELYYPENMSEFIKYCYEKNLLMAPSSISLWCKTDNDGVWTEDKLYKWGKWNTKEYFIENHPFPMKNIKTEKELDEYIAERKELKAIEISEKLSKHAIAVYDKNVIFPLISSITQEVCDNFIKDYNNRNLYEIIK